ncbi:putative NTF2-like domain-containing protein [Medicago truncatula]|uniref:Nuclear transport factor 2 n=1 Tax=Medicago truncatula TaxID=3880 RepID=A0A072VJ04_MEDTR|nr:nuclear transport factor 2A-like [Medicago truncatula]KEH38140.1 nuclear transport factor 2 [Medicago truncatula]RHN74256.1 putative NTF2-like domain-containing protein [Medicago truncatula]
MDPNALSKAFMEHYYTTFDTNRPNLAAALYHCQRQIMGSQNIVAKLTSFPFQQCHHSITTVDCQPSGADGGMLVFVSGNLQLADEQHGQQIMFLFLLNLLFMNPFSREELKMR